MSKRSNRAISSRERGCRSRQRRCTEQEKSVQQQRGEKAVETAEKTGAATAVAAETVPEAAQGQIC